MIRSLLSCVCNFVCKMIIIPYFFIVIIIHFPIAYNLSTAWGWRVYKKAKTLVICGRMCVQPYRFFSSHLLLMLLSVVLLGYVTLLFSAVFDLFNRRKTSICLISKLSAVITVWKPTITFSYGRNEPENSPAKKVEDGNSVHENERVKDDWIKIALWNEFL